MCVHKVMSVTKQCIGFCACLLWKFLVCRMDKKCENASSEPNLASTKWPASLGQNVRQLEKLVGAFPTTTLLFLFHFVSIVGVKFLISNVHSNISNKI